MAMSDTERLDWIEAAIRRAADEGLPACVVLNAWYSIPGDEPDGFAVNVGEYIPDSAEYPSIRDAIDAAASNEGTS